MHQFIQIKKGQLRIRWPYVRHETFIRLTQKVNEQKQTIALLESKKRELEVAVEELTKTVKANIHFHLGNPTTIEVRNEQGRETSMTAAARSHLMRGEDTPQRVVNHNNREFLTLRSEQVCYGFTCPENDILAMPSFIVRRMANVLVEEIIQHWKDNYGTRKAVQR